jgi:DNA-binding Lrp family transcriptional regulator
VRRPSRHDTLATVTDTDRRLLTLLSEQRVLTQTQLERLLDDVPARTLRYRTERLTRLGLVGRSRAYRDRGSAPFHYWPTRVSDAFVRGEPTPRGGERAEPNPQFLHHAERLSELYTLLAVQAPTVGLRLHSFKRERDAREPFRANGRERALAPDALIHLHDEDGRGLLAFVELDMGTMSHARLKTKAAGYGAHAANASWTERHPFCPCLLFLTTTETRAIAFLKILSGQLDRHGRGNHYSRRYFEWFAAAACAHAHEPERALVEACWDDLALAGGGLTISDCLNEARVTYDAEQAKKQAEERALRRTAGRKRPSPLRWRCQTPHVCGDAWNVSPHTRTCERPHPSTRAPLVWRSVGQVQKPLCTARACFRRCGPLTSTLWSPRAKISRQGIARVMFSGLPPAMPRRSCSLNANTTLRTFAQKIAPAHIAHGSVLVYSVQPCRNSGSKRSLATRTTLVSAWPVQSRPVTTVFSLSTTTLPAASTKSAPKGWFPLSRACWARSMAASRYRPSFVMAASRRTRRALPGIGPCLPAPAN